MVTLEVPVAVCYAYVKQSLHEARVLNAYAGFQRTYSGQIVQDVPEKLLVISEKALRVGKRHAQWGWSISYQFSRTSDTTTDIEVTYEYGFWEAILGWPMGTQAETQALFRVRALLALERGFQEARRREQPKVVPS
jgi:hypothetical protein